jgi:hypothetical protein
MLERHAPSAMSEMRGTGAMGKEVLSSELEADKKNGMVRGPKFEVSGTPNPASRTSSRDFPVSLARLA